MKTWLPILLLLVASVCNAGERKVMRFHATWCGPCREMQRVWDSVIEKTLLIPKVDVDIDINPTAKKDWMVERIPTTILVETSKDGKKAKEIGRLEGVVSKETLLKFLSQP